MLSFSLHNFTIPFTFQLKLTFTDHYFKLGSNLFLKFWEIIANFYKKHLFSGIFIQPSLFSDHLRIHLQCKTGNHAYMSQIYACMPVDTTICIYTPIWGPILKCTTKQASHHSIVHALWRVSLKVILVNTTIWFKVGYYVLSTCN